ncbi:MAG: ParA family protein [Chromatiales bacterium]|nr:ParA family protein [Chromatiales bacterium]
MKAIALFNNKGGVGKTSLVYHLSWMFSELGYRIIVADLDPQANLSSMFLSEERLLEIWQDQNKQTINQDILPLFDGIGDISTSPHIEEIDERIGLLAGDLELSKREDELSTQWSNCLDQDNPRAFRVITAFARTINYAHDTFKADLVLIDVGPNLGAINRAALIASNFVIIPLAADLFSLQGLRNVGPTLIKWREAWAKRTKGKPKGLDLNLPSGAMQPLGYILMRHSIHLSRPVKAYARWIEKMPLEYRESVLQEAKPQVTKVDNDEYLLAHLKDYRSLMPIAQEANKPMFMLKPADGVIGAQQKAVSSCYNDFKSLAEKIIEKLEKQN